MNAAPVGGFTTRNHYFDISFVFLNLTSADFTLHFWNKIVETFFV